LWDASDLEGHVEPRDEVVVVGLVDQGLRAAGRELIRDLVDAEARIHRHDHRAELQRTEEHDGPRAVVEHQHGNPVAAPHSPRRERRRAPVRSHVELRIRDDVAHTPLVVAEHVGRLVGHDRRVAPDDLPEHERHLYGRATSAR
jgi:hypothetical protein